jgi:SAM-dependent methyltransferase
MIVSDAAWTSVAPNWDRLRDHVEAMKADLTDQLVAGLQPLAGRRVLELGSGTGELAARLAAQTGPAGTVVASDFADGMVELLTRRLAGVPGTEVAKIDAAAIALESGSVDAVVFRMGLMLTPDPDVALAEIRRVLRPGGRAAVAVWGAPQDNPWMMTVGMAAMMHGLVSGGPPIGAGGPFSLADPDDLEKRARNAGFGTVDVWVVESTQHFDSVQEHVQVVSALAPHIAAALSAAAPEALDAVRRTVTELTSQYRDGDGFRIPLRALLCFAGT